MYNMLTMSPCNLCPRECGADRSKQPGYCGCKDKIKVARAAPHYWEEPCISGTRGSGTVFFSGCALKCCYCQNFDISVEGRGKEVSVERLAEIFLELQAMGVHNINLVTASHYLTEVIKALETAKPRLNIPVVYNTSGYERIETIEALKGYVDVYLPDIKYFSASLSHKYSKAVDYFSVASAAVKQMAEQTGKLEFDEQGILRKGVIIRHLVLPGAKEDSISILKWISANIPKDAFLLSLLCQYTPLFKADEYKEIDRRVTNYEYNAVVSEAVRLGIDGGFMQSRGSAKKEYTPPFDLDGV
jgi:putative pyruvate formate lyase activating enzyme